MAITIRFDRLALALIIPFITCALMSLDRACSFRSQSKQVKRTPQVSSINELIL